jgi:hypothetical protein
MNHKEPIVKSWVYLNNYISYIKMDITSLNSFLPKNID